MKDFREGLIERCKEITARSQSCLNEQAVKQSLILPFLHFLGYDVFDSAEVAPEHHADFSEKYQNKVDYAIMRGSQPVIAIEAKGPGANLRDDRGQLRSYFNAAKSVKLGILTNGIRYECYADSDEPNLMDEAAFLVFDVSEIAKGTVDNHIFEGIGGLRKAVFDPENVGAEARRKLLQQEFTNLLQKWAQEPDDELVKLLLAKTNLGAKRTARIVEESRPLVREAFTAMIDKAILSRVGFADRPVIKVEASTEAAPVDTQNPAEAEQSDIITTEKELAVYDYAIRRLAFLVKEEEMFKALAEVKWQDMKTTFKVFYKKPVAGGLFNFKEGKDGLMTFEFPALENKVISTHIYLISIKHFARAL